MPDIIKCPECQKALKLNAALAGKRVRCPGCKQPFVVPADEDVLEEVDPSAEESDEEDAGYQEVRPARRARRPRDEEDEGVRPARRARRQRDEEEEEDEEEECPRRKRRRPRPKDYDSDVQPSSAPLVLGILSIVFCCIPIVGFILGRFAMTKADEEMEQLPGGKRYRGAQKQMQVARVLGTIGMSLSVVLFVVAVVLQIMEHFH